MLVPFLVPVLGQGEFEEAPVVLALVEAEEPGVPVAL